MNFIQKMFSGVDKQYLIKSYLFSIILFVLTVFGSGTSLFTIVYGLLCAILFPFATVVWDDLVGAIMGSTVIVLPLPVMLIWKLFKLLLLFILTPFIAPIGFIYIYFANGYHKAK